MMKAALKRLAFGAAPFSYHVTVGLDHPTRITRVILEGLGPPQDVSCDHVPVSLRPLQLGLCLDASVSVEALRAARLRLVLQDWNDPHTTRGELILRPVEPIDLGNAHRRLWVFAVVGSVNRCIALAHLLAREARDWYHRRKKKPNPYNFRMTPPDLRALNVYYMRPRPVSLISVIHGEESDLFPMDLIGPLSSGQFTLALRSTSPAIRLMSGSRRIAVSAIPASFKAAAYALGTHHQQLRVDWSALPFATACSPEFALPVPRDALLVRELEIRDIRVIASHTFFITTVARQTLAGHGPAFCHIAGVYAHARGIPTV